MVVFPDSPLINRDGQPTRRVTSGVPDQKGCRYRALKRLGVTGGWRIIKDKHSSNEHRRRASKSVESSESLESRRLTALHGREDVFDAGDVGRLEVEVVLEVAAVFPRLFDQRSGRGNTVGGLVVIE